MKNIKKIISILFVALFVLGVSACGTEPKEHTTDFDDIEGQWTLDSIYKNSHAKDLGENYKQDMELSESKMTLTITTVKNKKNVTKTVEYTVSNVSDGSFTVTGNGETINYTFNYDPGANVVHLYNTDDNGKEVHTMYKEYTDEIPWESSKSDSDSKSTNSTDSTTSTDSE